MRNLSFLASSTKYWTHWKKYATGNTNIARIIDHHFLYLGSNITSPKVLSLSILSNVIQMIVIVDKINHRKAIANIMFIYLSVEQQMYKIV